MAVTTSPGFQAEDIGGARAGRAILTRRRSDDADVEAELALGGGIAGEGVIVAPAGLVIVRDDVKDMLPF